MYQTTMVLFVLGSTFLLALPDDAAAADKFFQTGGRFGKRHDERISGTDTVLFVRISQIIIVSYRTDDNSVAAKP